MNIKCFIYFLLFNISIVLSAKSPQQIFHPCRCNYDHWNQSTVSWIFSYFFKYKLFLSFYEITCSTTKNITIFRLFSESLKESNKHFGEFRLSADKNEEMVLPDGAFWDIIFDKFSYDIRLKSQLKITMHLLNQHQLLKNFVISSEIIL